MKMHFRLFFFKLFVVGSTSGLAQSSALYTKSEVFTPTISRIKTDLERKSEYKMQIAPDLFVPVRVKDSIDIEDLNYRLKFVDWNRVIGSYDIFEKTSYVWILKPGRYNFNYIDAKKRVIKDFMLPEPSEISSIISKKNSLLVENDSVRSRNKIQNNKSEAEKFCVNIGDTSPPDYKKLVVYLERNHSPCPNQSRGIWSKLQFNRLGKRIEELHKERPKPASDLMREFNSELSSYLITESHTGFEDEYGFRKCLKFIFSVDSAIDKIKHTN